MLGMLQIITYLLCIYLVFKGVEIYQIALASPKADKQRTMAVGIIMLIASIIIAVIFVIWVDNFANSIGNRMNSQPPMP